MTAVSTVTRPKPMSAAWALSRVEGRRLVTHPAVLASIAFSLVLLTFVGVLESDFPGGYDLVRILPLNVAVGTFIAANLGALRNRRHGTGDLYEAEPVTARQRTFAHLLSVIWAVAATGALVVVTVIVLVPADGLQVAFNDGIRHRIPTLVEMALGPIVVGLFGVVGVMAARWVPSVAVTVMAAAAALPYLMFESWGVVDGPEGWYTPLWSAAREFDWVQATAGSGYPIILSFALVALAWHLLYLIGLIVIASAVALAKHGWTRRNVLAGAVGVSAVVLGAVMQVAAATPWP
jgi:hypothetical protein